MRRFTFTFNDLDAIRHDRYHHPHPRVQQKMEVLWLKSQRLAHDDIARLSGVSRRSVQRYLDEFADGGLGRIRRLPWKGKANELAATRGWLLTRQFENEANADMHSRTTAREIVDDFKDAYQAFQNSGFRLRALLRSMALSDSFYTAALPKIPSTNTSKEVALK